MNIEIPEHLLPDSTFTCGPSQAHPDIKQATLGEIPFERSHRSAAMSADGLVGEATSNIRKLLRVPDDYAVIFFLGGATPALDATAWNMSKDSISGYCFGAFSNLWGKKICSQVPGVEKKIIADIEEGEIFPSGELDLNASFIFLTPNETSTGVAIPDTMLNDIYSGTSADSVVGWDCTSCAAGRLLPESSYDVMAFSLQKCFGSPGGTGILVMSPKAQERAAEAESIRMIPHSFRLSGKGMAIDRALSKGQTVNTPSTVNIWMANESAKRMLDAGGLEAMDELVKKHAKVLWDWVDSSDYLEPYVDDENFRSQVTIALKVDEAVDAADISKALAATGRPNLQDGIKKYSAVKGNVIRIGCFPFVDFNGSEQFEKLTQTVDFIVEQLKK